MIEAVGLVSSKIETHVMREFDRITPAVRWMASRSGYRFPDDPVNY